MEIWKVSCIILRGRKGWWPCFILHICSSWVSHCCCDTPHSAATRIQDVTDSRWGPSTLQSSALLLLLRLNWTKEARFLPFIQLLVHLAPCWFQMLQLISFIIQRQCIQICFHSCIMTVTLSAGAGHPKISLYPIVKQTLLWKVLNQIRSGSMLTMSQHFTWSF